MLFSTRGSMHTLMFVLIIFFGFGLALGLPQYRKHKNITEGRRALNRGGALSFTLSGYKQRYGVYTQDFSQLDLPEELAGCTLEEGGKALLCGEYRFTQEGGILTAAHVRFPKWFEFDLDGGMVDCSHADDSDAGRHLCEGINTSFPIKI